MDPKDKARELIIKMQFSKPPLHFDKAKQCALICVDEIVKVENVYLNDRNFKSYFPEPILNYWKKVKQEIEKL